MGLKGKYAPLRTLGLLTLCCAYCGHLSVASRSLNAVETSKEVQVRHGDVSGYPMFALRNPIENLVRIYGQFLPEVLGNKTSQGQYSELAGCMMRGQNKEELVENIKEIMEVVEFDPDTQKDLLFVNYVIDCRDPGPWATTVAVRVHGNDAGPEIDITLMAGSRKGKLAVCSQSLYGNVEWLKEWVDHQFVIGADEVILHTPTGTHIADLLGENRKSRLQTIHSLGRRRSFGQEALTKFAGDRITWQEYSASPSAQFHAEELIFSACHYRMRYAYDYTVQFDIDEFWTPGAVVEEDTLPAFLDNHMSKDAASIGFKQVLYPMECRSRNHGKYVSRFTLHEQIDREEKLAVRPFYVDRVHIHTLLEASPEYRSKQLQPGDHHWTVPSEMAFLKNIRWDLRVDEQGEESYNKCEFGEELDPHHTGLTVE